MARNCRRTKAPLLWSLISLPHIGRSAPSRHRASHGVRAQQYTLRTIFRRLNGKGGVWQSGLRQSTNLTKFERKLRRILNDA
jgi:hypothetical protein